MVFWAMATFAIGFGHATFAQEDQINIGRVIIEKMYSKSNDSSGEDEPYFMYRGFCSGPRTPFEIDEEQTETLGIQIDIAGSAEIEVWEKDGSDYDCGQGRRDDLISTFDIIYNQTEPYVTIQASTVPLGDTATVNISSPRAKYTLWVRVEPLVGDPSPPPPESNCSEENAIICSRLSGICEQARDRNDNRHDLCRWTTARDASECNDFSMSRGIWTTKSSPFANEWPSAVPGSLVGACITQMSNIGGQRE